MTLLGASQHIGKQVLWEAQHGVKVPVYLRDFKQSYGELRFRIEPVQGVGSTWVNTTSLDLKGGLL